MKYHQPRVVNNRYDDEGMLLIYPDSRPPATQLQKDEHCHLVIRRLLDAEYRVVEIPS